jgi:hypothetical protein
MLIGRRPRDDEDIVGAVSAALLERLLAALQASYPGQARLDESGRGSIPVFTRPTVLHGRETAITPVAVVGARGWGVALYEADVPQAVEGAVLDRLRRVLFQTLRLLCPTTEIEDARTVVVDDQFGREIPTDFLELAGLCVRMRAKRLVYGTTSAPVTQSALDSIEREATVSISRCVESLSEADGRLRVTFCKNLPPYYATTDEAAAIWACHDHPTLQTLCHRLNANKNSSHQVVVTVRRLERARTLYLTSSAGCLEHLGLDPVMCKAL